MKSIRLGRVVRYTAAAWMLLFFAGASFRVLADCSAFGLPFNDVTSFCAEIAEAYFSGLTTGTTATTFSPTNKVSRVQMAAFITRTLDQSLQRGSRRAALNQWWTTTPHYDQSLGLATVGSEPELLASDGADIWVANLGDGSVSRVRASDGKNLGTWTGASNAAGILVAMGKVFVAATGNLYMIDPTACCSTTSVATVGNGAAGMAFDGNKIWVANVSDGSISIVTPGTPFTAVLAGVATAAPAGLVFDGSNIWVTDQTQGKLLQLNSDGSAAVQTVTVGNAPLYPAFDGHNIWVPNSGDDTLTVVRASDGTVLKTFSTGQNGLNHPTQAAFDGQRILVTNQNGGLSLFKATDLSTIANPSTPPFMVPFGACSDGVDFWISDNNSTTIGRF